MAKKKASKGTGLEPNVAGLLCYVLGWISGIVFLVLEPKDKFVRYHAIQSIIVFGAISVVGVILRIFFWIPYVWVLFMILAYLVGVLGFILWIVLMLKAYHGQKPKMPIAGDYAEKHA